MVALNVTLLPQISRFYLNKLKFIDTLKDIVHERDKHLQIHGPALAELLRNRFHVNLFQKFVLIFCKRMS